TALTFSPDGKLLAAAASMHDATAAPAKRCAVLVWDVTDGKEVFARRDRRGTVRDLAFSPDGRLLACASAGMVEHEAGEGPPEVGVWDLPTGREVFTHKPRESCVVSVAFSPDGAWLVTGGGWPDPRKPGAVAVWDVRTGREAVPLASAAGRWVTVGFSRDGSQVIGVGPGVRVWDAATGRLVAHHYVAPGG